jgi:C-terminal processing protease CtpA/Prc
VIKKCTVRKLKGKEDKPLGFEMTKRPNVPHYVSKIEPNSAADLAGLSVDDYLIELNDKNIERDENSLLREKIFKLLEPNGAQEFSLTTINKDGFDYCNENGISPSNFIQVNKQTMQYFETPLELSVSQHNHQTRSTNNDNLNLANMPPLDINIDKRIEAAATASATAASTPSRYSDDGEIPSAPRLCVLHKSADIRELGFSVARIKNFNEHIINDVVSNSIADQAGLKPNDILLEVSCLYFLR